MSVNSLALVRHANLSSHNFFVTVAIQNCGVKNNIMDLLIILFITSNYRCYYITAQPTTLFA